MRQRGRAGTLRAYLLFLNEKPISYLYSPLDGATAVYRYLGYDPEYAELSPGFVLQWLALECLFKDHQVGYFDFTQGEGEQKRFFATDSRQCADIYFLERSAKRWALVLAHRATDLLSTALGNGLDRLGLKARLKRLLRRG